MEEKNQEPAEVDYIIVGQGISGTWLSYYLEKEGLSLMVIDNNDPSSPSRIAAGIINPVTGRRHVTVWMAEELLPFAWQAYSDLGHRLGIGAISQKTILDFFPTAQMRASFLERVEEGSPYLHAFPEQNKWNSYLNYDFGCGETRPVYTVHLETLLPAWRDHLEKKGILSETKFDVSKLVVNGNGVRYGNTKARKIIFCDGNGSVSNPWFEALPFAPNKGEALVVEIPDLPGQHIYKKGMMLVPLETQGQWWIGSSYEWEFEDSVPSAGFLEKTTALLEHWLKVPFKILSHHAALRPATIERRPFVGFHPQAPAVGLLNGMGTKGCSLAPYFAKQMADHLVYHLPLSPEADIMRFKRMLSR